MGALGPVDASPTGWTAHRRLALAACALVLFGCARSGGCPESTLVDTPKATPSSASAIPQAEPAAATPTAGEPAATARAATAPASAAGAAGIPNQALGQHRLELATWNLKHLRYELGRGAVKRSAVHFERLAEIGNRIDPDVIALQEVDGPKAAARVFDERKYAFHFSSRSDPLRTGFAYKKDLHERNIDVEPLPDLSTLDVGGLRHGTELRIRVGGEELVLMSVHLKSGCWDSYLAARRKACRKLSAQLVELERWIDDLAAKEVPFVLLGDFNRNFEPPDEFWPEIDDQTPPNADLTAFGVGEPPACWSGRHESFVDHIVVDRLARAWTRADSFKEWNYDRRDAPMEHFLSDHCPLSIELWL